MSRTLAGQLPGVQAAVSAAAARASDLPEGQGHPRMLERAPWGEPKVALLSVSVSTHEWPREWWDARSLAPTGSTPPVSPAPSGGSVAPGPVRPAPGPRIRPRSTSGVEPVLVGGSAGTPGSGMPSGPEPGDAGWSVHDAGRRPVQDVGRRPVQDAVASVDRAAPVDSAPPNHMARPRSSDDATVAVAPDPSARRLLSGRARPLPRRSRSIVGPLLAILVPVLILACVRRLARRPRQ